MDKKYYASLALATLLMVGGPVRGIAQCADQVAGVLCPTPAGPTNQIAQELSIPSGTSLEAIRVYNNDGLAPLGEIRIVSGELAGDLLILAAGTPVGGLSSDWETVSLDHPVSSSSEPLFVVVSWPAYRIRTGRGPGTGPGIGYYFGCENAPGSWSSADGVSWDRIHSELALAIEPIFGAGGLAKTASSSPSEGAESKLGVPRVDRVFPNPSNPAVAIVFELPHPTDVSVRVYNSRGQLVRKLVNRQFASGRQEVVWHGQDAGGNPVSAGVFFLRVSLNGAEETHKVTIVQ